ncbi:NAD(P)H nitroreductase [Enterovibrio nigricans]|uniref:Putative NAD(P)H nitroreductase n=1 Tax=Enterovibrio nigricans DSM 22720 TaxID=1121868 RepID=A0A1T4UCR5_9GAMM|nr:NAD(P)H nitroreductase [Enterovibrio nigricans]PKF50186.1 NAD(P)H nitroreductase [Enterovibrio nigricans]SKA50494.1 Nitroreductase [Enterovibrio nigricans DSM 22720]
MDALSLLTQRRSIPRLLAPAPSRDALENMIAAGLRAPDHGALTPWEFVIATGEGLEKLSAILKTAAEADNEDPAVIEKTTNAPFRAPMVITVIARTKLHDKVPVIEQHISAGCAAQAMQMAAVAQGFQGFWRTGKWAYHPSVREAFGVSGDDEIVGFLYVGTPDCTPANAPKRDTNKYVKYL